MPSALLSNGYEDHRHFVLRLNIGAGRGEHSFEMPNVWQSSRCVAEVGRSIALKSQCLANGVRDLPSNDL